MTRFSTAALLSLCTCFAQTPDLSGVWQADMAKSQVAGPPVAQYLVIIEQHGPKLSQLTGTSGQRGEQRFSYIFNTDGQPSISSYRGVPARTQSSWKDGKLVAETKIAGAHPSTMSDTYTLSTDGQTLTIDSAMSMGGRDMKQTIVLAKQPDSAGEPLRKPEQTAGERFKNVKLMKEVPASQFMDAMRYFTFSLGVDCEHCHVEHKFDADDKKEKEVARKMMLMTHTANEQTFGGKNEVHCYTCHRGVKEPQSLPSF
jgi:hypothetical protein